MTDNFNLIPYPEKLTIKQGSFCLGKNVTVTADNGLENEIEYLVSRFAAIGVGLTLAGNQAKGQIELRLDKPCSFDDEGYKLDVSENCILVAASTSTGIFYAIQTLMQILPTQASGAIKLPCVSIEDKPRFKWRGFLLDVSRHFVPVEAIKKHLDLLSMHKFNIFHWHLVDDQGWRLEIKKYPKLTELAAWRDRTLVTHLKSDLVVYEEKPHGGFYTQQQIKEVIEYARKLHIQIIPEVEMPGHASAVLSVYPQFACPGYQQSVKCKWGIFEDIFCAGNDEVFTFIEDILKEVVALFPSEYIHIGGDEVPKAHWKKCPLCQKRIKENGLKNEEQLQSYFIKRAESILKKYNKKLIGWDEILEGGLAPDATVMSWRGFEGGVEAARQKHDVVICPVQYCYFDHSHTTDSQEPLAIGGPLSVEQVYMFEPVPDELESKFHKYILGGQACIWTEYIRNPEALDYMAYPRTSVLSEVLWSNRKKDYKAFKQRLQRHLKRLDSLNVEYCKNW